MKWTTAIAMMFVAALVLVMPLKAFAVGTAAGTDITNTATVTYEVDDIPQPSVDSNTVTFVVDNMVDLTVVRVGGYVTVAPGSTLRVLRYTVTNTGNGTQDYSLAATNGIDELGGSDNFDATNVNVFVESNPIPNGYQVGVDTATFINALAPDDSATVYVVSDIDISQANGDISAITLTATTLNADNGILIGSTMIVAGVVTVAAGGTVAADNPAVVDVVFADDASEADAARDRQHSDTHSYRVVTALLTVTKASVIISDPINAEDNPKAIPGAVIEYTITVDNAGTVAATSVTINDTPDTDVTFNPDTYGLGTGLQIQEPGINGGAVYAFTNADDGVEINGAQGEAIGTITVEGIILSAGETATLKFRVTIN